MTVIKLMNVYFTASCGVQTNQVVIVDLLSKDSVQKRPIWGIPATARITTFQEALEMKLDLWIEAGMQMSKQEKDQVRDQGGKVSNFVIYFNLRYIIIAVVL